MQREDRSFPDLITLLEEEVTIYSQIRDLLERERHALLHMAASELGEICAAKETLALRIKALDESRRILSERLGRRLSISPDDLTVSKLCEFAPAGLKEKLSIARDQLREQALACRELNEINASAARKGLEIVTTAVEFLVRESDPAGKVYEAKKSPYAAAARRAPAIVSRQM
jgi:flagellar biosynthesis/type III secretory pathway chaperone